MSEPIEPTEPNVSATEPSPPSTEPASGQTPATPAEPSRLGAEASYLAGKTAAEAGATVNQLVQTIQALQAQANQPQQLAAQPKEVDADLMLSDPAAWQAQFAAKLQAQTAAQMNQAAAPIVQNNVESVRFMSQMDPNHKDTWSRWGNEVEAKVMSIPAHLRTKGLYDEAANMVRGSHVSELAKEEAQKLVASGSFGVEGSGGGTVAEPAADAEVWSSLDNSALGQLAKQLGPQYKTKIRDAVKSMPDESLETYVAKLADSKAIMDPLKPGTWRTELK